MTRCWRVLWFTSLLASCQSLGLPPGSGKGIVSFDREPPQGVELFERPVWQKGDRFVYWRGGIMRLAFQVAEQTEDGYVLVDEQTGVRTRLTLDLGFAGSELPGEPESARVEDPAEALLHWPLWEGKRWSCHTTATVWRR
jgi:hypothetical protein